METQARFSIADYVVFVIALLLSAAIGVYYGCTGGKQKTVSEFLMADRKMPLLPAAMSILASFMSAISMLGTPAETYQYGTMYIWIIISYVFTILISAYVYIPVFYNLHVTSAYEYLEARFSRGVRIYGAFAYILQTSLYMAMVLYAPALALSAVTGIQIWVAVLSTGIVCTFYTALGGMKAVMWTDTLQVGIMYAGILAAIIQGCIEQGGGHVVWQDAVDSGRIDFYKTALAFNLNPLERHTFWTLTVGGMFTWTAIYAVNQSQVQRALTVPSLKIAQTAYLINIAGLTAFALLGSFCGLIIYSRYKGCDPLAAKLVDSSDQLYPFFVIDILGHLHGLSGLFTAAIFSGALSTISSGLNSVAAVTLEDLVKTLIKPNITDERATLVSKCLAIGYGALAIALAFVAGELGGILQAALSLFGMLGGPILGVYTLGMFFPCANSKGAYIGMTSAFLLTLWIGIGQQVYKPRLPKHPLSIASCKFLNDTKTLELYNTTTASIMTSAPQGSESLSVYNLSYLWFSAVGCVSTVLVGSILSCATGSSEKKVEQRLLSPLALAVYRWLPAHYRQRCCGSYVSSSQSEDDGAAVHVAGSLKTSERLEVSPSQVQLMSHADSTSQF